MISLLVTTLAIIVYSLVSTQLYYKLTENEKRDALEVYASMFSEDEYTFDDAGAEEFSRALGGARVTFLDGEGNVVGESEADRIEEDHSDRAEIRDAMQYGSGYAVRSSDTLSRDMMYYCVAAEADGQRVYVRVAEFMISSWAMYAQLLPSLISYLIIDVLGCFVFTFIATYFILRPVEDLTREAAGGGTVKTKYSELSTIADILNERNRNIEWKIGRASCRERV